MGRRVGAGYQGGISALIHLRQMFKTAALVVLRPHSDLPEDAQRREYILRLVVLGMLGLTVAALITSSVNLVLRGESYIGVQPFFLAAVAGFLVVLYRLRLRYLRRVSQLFLGIFYLLGTYPLAVWGINIPQGLLIYTFVIVLSGVLISSRAAWISASLIALTLLLLISLQTMGFLAVDRSWLNQPGNITDAIIFAVTMGVIAIVSWLSSRDIEASLARARESEKALRKERNLLEHKVFERTKELEKAQLEQLLQLEEFAAFGRLSAGIIHDLSNPLTAATLNLEQIPDSQLNEEIEKVKLSISYIQRYVASARHQLLRQTGEKWFSIREEADRVMNVLEHRAKRAKVRVVLKIAGSISLYGDPAHFNQLIANLLANSIDSYETSVSPDRRVVLSAEEIEGFAVITITDWGPGIPKDAVGHIFEPFFSTKTGRGLGIGLYAAKAAVEDEFDGSINVTSSGKGTKFVVRIPLGHGSQDK